MSTLWPNPINGLAPACGGETGRRVPLPPAPPLYPSEIALSARVAQGGAFAGVRNTVNTVWLPAGQAVEVFSGRVSLSSNGPGFSEALVQLGTTLDGQAACRARDGSATPDIPPNRRIWAGILKNTGAGVVQQPVRVTMPHALPWSNGQGACLLTIVSAGYPFLSRTQPLYTTTDVALTARLASIPAHEDPRLAIGIGGEFKLQVGDAPPSGTYVGLRADRTLRLDGIATTLSAAPVTGAPSQAGWGTPPEGPWSISTDFVLVRAESCRQGGFRAQASDGRFAILRSFTPAPVGLPPGSSVVLHARLAGRGIAPEQSWDFRPVPPLTLAPGDCLLAIQANVPTPGTPSARVDVENQSTVYLSQPTP